MNDGGSQTGRGSEQKSIELPIYFRGRDIMTTTTGDKDTTMGAAAAERRNKHRNDAAAAGGDGEGRDRAEEDAMNNNIANNTKNAVTPPRKPPPACPLPPLPPSSSASSSSRAAHHTSAPPHHSSGPSMAFNSFSGGAVGGAGRPDTIISSHSRNVTPHTESLMSLFARPPQSISTPNTPSTPNQRAPAVVVHSATRRIGTRNNGSNGGPPLMPDCDAGGGGEAVTPTSNNSRERMRTTKNKKAAKTVEGGMTLPFLPPSHHISSEGATAASTLEGLVNWCQYQINSYAQCHQNICAILLEINVPTLP